jgi:hypothetical protein
MSCGLCRAFPRKTHGKGFAVRLKRTTNNRFPVGIKDPFSNHLVTKEEFLVLNADYHVLLEQKYSFNR